GALVLNLLVAGTGAVAFARAGHLRAALLLPFAAWSVPLAFLGGRLRLPPGTYDVLLAAVLAFAALRMLFPRPGEEAPSSRRPPVAAAAGLGAGIGLLSGLVGVGGGIFLSPILLLARWATPKEAAAASAAFIVLNSAAGLGGRATRGDLDLSGVLPLAAAALVGGAAGSLLGARVLLGTTLRRILGVVLAIATGKLAYRGLGG
ncbi:MAG: TSUP family transporter, partial [Planctomycetales bacterium]|nr:TSUP family transporter [Planctomycetales bacterium]